MSMNIYIMNCTLHNYKNCVNIMIQLAQLNGKKYNYDDKIMEVSNGLGKYEATDKIYKKAASFYRVAISQNKKKSISLIPVYFTIDADDWVNFHMKKDKVISKTHINSFTCYTNTYIDELCY